MHTYTYQVRHCLPCVRIQLQSSRHLEGIDIHTCIYTNMHTYTYQVRRCLPCVRIQLQSSRHLEGIYTHTYIHAYIHIPGASLLAVYVHNFNLVDISKAYIYIHTHIYTYMHTYTYQVRRCLPCVRIQFQSSRHLQSVHFMLLRCTHGYFKRVIGLCVHICVYICMFLWYVYMVHTCGWNLMFAGLLQACHRPVRACVCVYVCMICVYGAYMWLTFHAPSMYAWQL